MHLINHKSNYNTFTLPEDTLDVEDQFVFDRIKFFVITYFKSHLKPHELQVIHFLEGSCSINDIGLTKENSSQFLTLIKLIDLAIAWQNRISKEKVKFQNPSFPIRTRILELCSPQMTTAEAYTKTLNKIKYTDKNYLKNPHSWVLERSINYTRLIANEYIKVRALSAKLNSKKRVIIAIKGTTAAGKTTMIKEIFPRVLDEGGDILGVLNPDTFKAALKKNLFVTNKQIHDEGAALFANFQRGLTERNHRISMIIDKRLPCIQSLQEYVIEPIKKMKGIGVVIDIDIPLEISLIRVLTRNPYGKEPCPSLKVIIEGAIQQKEQRLSIIERIKQEKRIKEYKLYRWNKKGVKKLVAEKRKNMFNLLCEKDFKKCIKVPSLERINRIIKQKITPDYINSLIVNNTIHENDRKHVERWLGKSLEEALNLHVL